MSTWVRRLGRLSAASVAVTLGSVAWACPYCANQNQDAGVGGIVLLGAMIALPFVVCLAVLPALKRAAAGDVALTSPESE